MNSKRASQHIRRYFETLYRAWGCQHWWPAESPFEVIVGAYLTQNTSWTNVERALASLREAGGLSVSGIRALPLSKLEQLIRSSGYFRQKSQRLKEFIKFLDERYSGSLDQMFARPTSELREELLALNGVGPETADSILLYAGNHPVFVVDTYTRRIVERHDLLPVGTKYEEIRDLFERALEPTIAAWNADEHSQMSAVRTNGPAGSCHLPSRMSRTKRAPAVQVFNEMHGLIVGVGKNFCKKSQPECERCPLKKYLPKAK